MGDGGIQCCTRQGDFAVLVGLMAGFAFTQGRGAIAQPLVVDVCLKCREKVLGWVGACRGGQQVV
ncbi:hypothetical protein D3C81_2061770 [compost metagenome]